MTLVDGWLKLDTRRKITAVHWNDPALAEAYQGLAQIGRRFAEHDSGRFTWRETEFRCQEMPDPPEGALVLLRRAAASAAPEREYLYRRALDEVSDGVQIYDRQARLVYMNQTSRRISGIPGHLDFEGRPLLDLYDLDEEISSVMTTLRTRQPVIDRFDSFKAPGGRMVSTVNTAHPVFRGRELMGAVCFEQNLESIDAQVDRLAERKMMVQDRVGRPAGAFSGYQFSDLIGSSRDFAATVALAKKIAPQDCHVLLVGETGTGKEVFAQSMYRAGRRHRKKFVAVNCAAVPDTLIESVFFGTSKGSFTGSVDKPGLLEEADGGVLFLDELNSMSLSMQSKLLRAIEANSFRRVGGVRDIRAEVRFISSCNDSPARLIENNLLRTDLYYRLSAVSIDIPPLRERLDDLDELAAAYLARQSRHYLKSFPAIPPGIMELFRQYSWPGNVREFFNVLDYILNTMDGETIELPNLPRHLRTLAGEAFSHAARDAATALPPAEAGFAERLYPGDCADLDGLMQRLERDIIEGVLIQCRYNVSRAAARLNLGRQTLQYRLKKLGLDAASKQE
ncbi:MAG: sigma 54-interacting transcriptional regulator, partial [Candidatus Adiutrix sp.]|nr:sigma 54-interacting transcriptional regulator [Candidatus Adiutrix sp.]